MVPAVRSVIMKWQSRRAVEVKAKSGRTRNISENKLLVYMASMQSKTPTSLPKTYRKIWLEWQQ